MWYVEQASQMSRLPIGLRHHVAVLALIVVGALAYPCGAQTPPPTPQVQSQAVQIPQPAPSVGTSRPTNIGPPSAATSAAGFAKSSSVGKRFGSVGQGLPGMSGGPPIKGSMGYQDPSGRYMHPSEMPSVLCDPAVTVPC